MIPFYESQENQISCAFGPEGDFPSHFHREVELFYLLEGDMEVEFSGKREILSAGSIAIAFPNEIHSYKSIGENKHLILIFDPSFCPDFFPVFLNNRLCSPFVYPKMISENATELLNMLNIFVNTLRSDPSVSLVLIKGYLTVLLYRLFEMLELRSYTPHRNRDIAAQVTEYMNNHYLEPMSLSKLSQALGYNQYEISRVFSGKLHISFNDHLNSLRLEHAVTLLTETNLPITEIAFTSGFESLRTFYRVFTSKYGLPPLKYRVKHDYKQL